jgi:LysM repeat protein
MVEYMAEPLGSTNYYTDDFILVENSVADIRQIFNDDSSYHTTKNIQDLTVVPIGSNTYAYLDSEKLPNYLTYDSTNLTATSITGYNVVMEKARFHFVAGFDFDQFVALILSVSHTENNGKKSLFANILLSPETIAELIIFNPKPLFISNAMYDRYIDILVPSIKNINEDYKTSAVPANTFVAAITPTLTGSLGFIYNNPIDLGLAECSKKKTIFTASTNYDSYEVSEFYTATVSQSNEFDNVGAQIGESTVGDYIEFYLTFNSGFPEELISILNRRNPSADWVIIHQLSIFEQLGSSFINTSRQVFFQEDGFDEPNIFRPVLKNANHAVSMSIDLISRLTNRQNGEQIIREASFNLISPKKYGKKLSTLPILDKPGSQTVYNKIIKNQFEATSLFIEPAPIVPQSTTIGNGTPTGTVLPATTTPGTMLTYTEYVPVFFNNNNISIASTNSMVKTSDKSEEIVFGPGKLRFILSPFDNLLKFKVYTNSTSSTTNSPIELDLNTTAPTYKIVFETNNGKLSIKNAGDAQLENLSTGVIAFTISRADSEIIFASKNRTIYITSVSQDGRETFMYSGEWRKPSEQEEVDLAVSTALANSTKQQNLQAILDKISSLNINTKSELEKLLANKSSSIKLNATPSIVNKFGIKDSKSLQTTTANLVSGNIVTTSNATATPASQPNSTLTYTVVVGDNLTNIAQRYGVTLNSIRAKNNLQTDVLNVGQNLIITF